MLAKVGNLCSFKRTPDYAARLGPRYAPTKCGHLVADFLVQANTVLEQTERAVSPPTYT